MIRVAKEAAARAAHALRVDRFVSRTLGRRRAAILLYHDPSPERMDVHLEYLRRAHAPIPLEVLVRALETGDWSPVPPGAVVVTIDDGLRGNAALLDVFRRHKVVPTIYACSSIVGTAKRFWFQLPGVDPEPLKLLPNEERLSRLAASHGFALDDATESDPREALSRSELHELKEAVSFGSHTRTHPILLRCDDATAQSEIRESKRELEELLGLPCEHFAFPNGDYGERELGLVRAAGYRSARTTDVGWNGPSTDRYRLCVLTRGADEMSVPLLALHLAGIAIIKQSVSRRAPGRARRRPCRTADV